MARINVEDSLFKDKRFFKLALKFQCRTKALGAITEAFIVAQRFYLSTVNDRLIPFDEWKKNELHDEIIEVGLAEKRDKGIYICGSENQFAWLIQRSEAGKHNNHKNQHTKVGTTVNDRATERNGSEPLTLSLTLNTKTNTKREKTSQSSVATQEFIKIYSDALKSKYGENAKLLVTPKLIGQINRLVKDIGLTKANDLIQVYFQMEDPWFKKKSHDFSTFITNLQSIALAFDTGKENGSSKIDYGYVFGGTDNDAS